MVLFKRMVWILYASSVVKEDWTYKIHVKIFKKMKSQYSIMHLGGSLVVPTISDTVGIDIAYLKKLRIFLLSQLKKKKKLQKNIF